MDLIKTAYMQKTANIILLAATIILASCGATTKDSDEVKEKKAKLETLKKEQEATTKAIANLEKELAKIDTSFGKEEKAKLVVLTTVAPEKFAHFIDLQGKIESENISIITPRGGPGQVKAVYVKRGDAVRKGQLLLKLDDAVARQQVASATQGVNTAKTQVEFLKNIYQKQKNLWDQNIGTEVQLISAKNNVENAENQLKSAQEGLNLAKEQLSFSSVTSDVDGVADDVNVRVGETFMGMIGATPQIRIVNTANLKASAQIPENYLGKVGVGTPVKITLPDLNRDIDAKVTASGKLIDPINRSFFIEAKIPTDKSFRPNQIALVRIQDYTAQDAITIPVNTLQTDDKGRFVMVAVKENGKQIARKKQVTIGELYGNKLEVKSGLQAGDVIISDGFQNLYDGQLLTTGK